MLDKLKLVVGGVMRSSISAELYAIAAACDGDSLHVWCGKGVV